MAKKDLSQMRKAIMSAYKAPKWKERVYNMNPNQVAAIYKSMRDSKRFKLVAGEFHLIDSQNEDESYHQYTIWELF